MIRQEFIENGKWLRYNSLADALKGSENYKGLPAQSAQQTLKVLDRTWKSFFNSMKAWKKDRLKFKARPRLPGYKDKGGEFMVIFTNQQVKVRDGKLIFPEKASVLSGSGFRFSRIQEVRLNPMPVGYVLDVVYVKDIEPKKRDRSRVAAIDLGVRNLVTVVNNFGESPIVVKGGFAKGMNQYFNKEKARLVSIYDKQGIKYGLALKRLLVSRNRKMKDHLHKVSRAVVEYLAARDVGMLVIGKNDGWKQEVNIGRRNNQMFVSIPFDMLIGMIRYKAEEEGIEVVLQEESYTSKCSFFDGEDICKHETNDYAGLRVRGLFVTAKRRLVNADVNGAFNILRKAIPKAFADGIEGVMDHPLRLVVSF
jgi:putative transposase